MTTTEVKSKFGTLKDVIFVYSSVTYPNKQLNKENKPHKSDHALEMHSWEIKVLVTEERFKALKKKYKGAKNFPNAKELTPEECEKDYGIPKPETDLVLIKFSQSCLTGRSIPDPLLTGKTTRKGSIPIKLIGIVDKVQDRSGNLITATTDLGNGTKGHLQFNPGESEHGVYLYPVAVCVTDLVEYTGGAGSMDEEAFGIEELEKVDHDDIDSDMDEAFSDLPEH